MQTRASQRVSRSGGRVGSDGAGTIVAEQPRRRQADAAVLAAHRREARARWGRGRTTSRRRRRRGRRRLDRGLQAGGRRQPLRSRLWLWRGVGRRRGGRRRLGGVGRRAGRGGGGRAAAGRARRDAGVRARGVDCPPHRSGAGRGGACVSVERRASVFGRRGEATVVHSPCESQPCESASAA